MQKTALSRKTGLKPKTSLKRYTPLKQQSPITVKQKTAKKRSEPYHSIFASDMHCCIITGDTNNVDPHHIFGGCDKTFSEKYGFMLPLRRDWHEGTPYSIHQDRVLELEWKIRCQEYWCDVLGKTKEEWLRECHKWYIRKAA